MYKKTNKKVEVCNGTKIYTRTVYVDEFGFECFKDNKKWIRIYSYTNKRGDTLYNARFYNGVKYIEAE